MWRFCILLNSRHKERASIKISLIFPSTRTKTLKGIFENIIPVYNVVQIWPGLIVCKQVTVYPGNIWTTLYISTNSLSRDSSLIITNFHSLSSHWIHLMMVSAWAKHVAYRHGYLFVSGKTVPCLTADKTGWLLHVFHLFHACHIPLPFISI